MNKSTEFNVRDVEEITIKILECLRCGFRWMPVRYPFQPGSCPRCRSLKWNKQRIRPIRADKVKTKENLSGGKPDDSR